MYVCMYVCARPRGPTGPRRRLAARMCHHLIYGPSTLPSIAQPLPCKSVPRFVATRAPSPRCLLTCVASRPACRIWAATAPFSGGFHCLTTPHDGERLLRSRSPLRHARGGHSRTRRPPLGPAAGEDESPAPRPALLVPARRSGLPSFALSGLSAELAADFGTADTAGSHGVMAFISFAEDDGACPSLFHESVRLLEDLVARAGIDANAISERALEQQFLLAHTPRNGLAVAPLGKLGMPKDATPRVFGYMCQAIHHRTRGGVVVVDPAIIRRRRQPSCDDRGWWI